MYTEAQIAAADRVRPIVAQMIAATVAKNRSLVATMDPTKLPASPDAMLAAGDRMEALIANADAKLVLDLSDAGSGYNGQITDQQQHIPYMALLLALVGKPKTDDRSRALNRIAAAL